MHRHFLLLSLAIRVSKVYTMRLTSIFFPFDMPLAKKLMTTTNNSPDIENLAASKTQEDPAVIISVDEPDNSLPAVQLEALPEALQQGCIRAGWTSLMPVQSRALPYLLAGRDLMVQSRTGSGKTGTYLLPLLKRLTAARQQVQGLVLVPTRELALQVEREARLVFEGTGLEVIAVYGGVGYGKQLDALRNGAALVVGTPGRVLDHLLRKSMNLDALRALIFDEADRMLSIGFYQDMKDIQCHLPKHPLQVTLFSATYPPYVLKLAAEFMNAPDLLSLSHSQVHVAEVQHMYCECKPMDKDRALVRLIEVENPSSAIIFCNTKSNVHYVTAVLQGFGLNADELSADLSQSKREQVLESVRQGTLRFLVATDVAARGIDIPELSHVFLYEPPEDRESYIHRAGRTGRAGAAGVVISLVDLMQKMELQRIASFFKINLLEMPTPDDQDVARVVGARTMTMLEARARQKTNLERERLRRFMPLIAELAQDSDQVQLLALLIDEMYQDSMHQRFLPETASAPVQRIKQNKKKPSESLDTPSQSKQGSRRRRRRPQGNTDNSAS